MGSNQVGSDLVSIIVPVYNAEQYIKKCIESILDQTYSNLELILVDDGSPDNSGVICDEYAKKDARIKVIHTPNQGVSQARNTGIDNANGEYLFFVDSDDWVSPDYVRNLLPVYGDELVHGGYICMKDGDIAEESLSYKAHVVEHTEWVENFLENWSKGPIVGPCGSCYKRSILEMQNIRFDTTIDIAEDELFNLEYLRYCNKVRYIEKYDYFYTIGKSGSSMNRHHPCRTQSAIKVSEAQEQLIQKKDYNIRWIQWHSAIAHHRKWMKKYKGAKKKNVARCLRDCYRTSYFRECIPFIRKNGTLDQKVETFFMNSFLHPFYPACYKSLVTISRIIRH